jgi:hypothetical protein
MALGNPNATKGSKKNESPFKGFENYNVQVYTKNGDNFFKVERSFIMNAPTEDYFENEEDFLRAEAEHKKLMNKYNKHLSKWLENPTDRENAYYYKQHERNMRILSENDGKVAYGTFPADAPTVSSLDGVIYNMSQKLDVIVSTNQKTEKLYFDMVDFNNKQIYRINSSFSTATRNWLDCIMRLDSLKTPIQLKFETEMKPETNFKEPKMKDGKPVVSAVMMSEFRDGYYRKKVKPLYYNYDKDRNHLCEEGDAKEYNDALQFAIKKGFNGDIIQFFVEKTTNLVIPRLQKEMKSFFREMGFEVEYLKNDKIGLFVPNFKKEGSDDSDEDFEDFTPTKNEVLETPKDTVVEKGAKKSKKASSSADDEDLPF